MMARRKSVNIKWTLVLLIVVVVCPFVHSRPQESTSVKTDVSTENSISVTSKKIAEKEEKTEPLSTTTSVTETPREVKTKVPIRESIKLVANQLLDKPNITEEPVVIDSRIPPKVKNQVKNKLKTNKHEDSEDSSEYAHAGEAVPVTMDEIETENSVTENGSTTTNEGISTWILVSNPSSNSTVSTEPTKTEDPKKQKPLPQKNKNKKPPNKNVPKRPVIGSTNKSDLIAGGSAINENVYNKIKDTVLTNVQKNKTPSTTRATTMKPTTTTLASTTEATTTTKKEETKAPAKTSSTTKSSTKTKKKNKNKNKVKVTEEPVVNDSAMLPMEAKEQEIELEVSTPPTTTKKPKRSSLRKKTKTKKRKTSKPKPEEQTAISEIKTSANKTKAVKPAKKPETTAVTTSIYNYLSREVMPSVGVGVLGLASLVGIASYFFYPFSTPVRRTFEVDKRDDLYKNNAEDYASEGNGQAEEEMLGTVLAGMPAHAKNKLNPYAGQTAYLNRYPVKNEQDIRYRQVATKYEPNYNVRYPQQKTGIAHAAVYSKPVNYSPHYETRHAYTTEGKFNFDKLPTSYNYNYPTVEPIYAAPQTGPSSSGISSYGNEASNSVVYGVKPASEADFKPVYPFETHFYSETTNSPATYAPTSMYLGSDNEAQTEEKVETSSLSADDEDDESKFVVGNVPKELADSATPAVVPEHGPRKLNRKKRSANKRRSISTSLEEILKNERDNNIFLSNEIDDSYTIPIKNLAPVAENMHIKEDLPVKTEEVIPVYATSIDPKKDETTTIKNEIIESVSTIPINNNKEEKSTTEIENDSETTTKGFKVYEVFSSPDATSSPVVNEPTKESTTFRSIMTETTTEIRSETTSTMPSTETKEPGSFTLKPTPIYPDVITYPPSNQPGGFFSFLKRLVDFKVRLGLSILQNTSDSLNKFLKSIDTTTQRAAKAQKAKEN